MTDPTIDHPDAPLGAGHNRPPTDEHAMRVLLEEDNIDLSRRAADLLAAVERVPETFANEDEQTRASDFIKQIDGCRKNCEAGRKASKEPYMQAGRLVDGFFKGLSDPLDVAKKTVQARVTTFLQAKEAEERRLRRITEQEAADAAAAAQKAADEAEAAAKDDATLDDAVQAEDAANEAAAIAADAAKEADAKAAELSRTRGEHGSVSSLRTFWVHDEESLSRATLDLEALRDHLPVAGLHQAVRSAIKAGEREIRGVRIYEKKEAVVR